MSKTLTIHGLPDEVVRRLEQTSEERGQSVDATVLQILTGALDLTERRRRLERYATWSDEDLQQFDKALALQRTIDEELWR